MLIHNDNLLNIQNTFIAIVLLITSTLVLNSGYIWPGFHIEYSPYNVHRLIQGIGLATILLFCISQSNIRHQALVNLRLHFAPSALPLLLLALSVSAVAATSQNLFGLYQLTFFIALVLCAGVLSAVPPTVVAICIVAPLSIYSLLSILQLSTYSLLGLKPQMGDIALGFSNRRFLSHFHTVAIPLSIAAGLFFNRTSAVRYLILALSSLTICHLIFSGSRGSAIAIIAGTVIASVLFRKRMIPFVSALFICTLVAIGITALLSNGWSGAEHITLVRGGTSGRLDLWLDAISKIWERPLFGYGAGGYLIFSAPQHSLSTPHNSFLLIALEHGLPAALLFTALVAHFCSAAIRRVYAKSSVITLAAAVSLFAAIIHSLVSGIQLTATGQLGLMALLAILMWQPPVSSPPLSTSKIFTRIFLASVSITLLLLSIQIMIAGSNMASPTCDNSERGSPRVWRYLDSPCS